MTSRSPSVRWHEEPVLEGSAVLVELRRIADALDDLRSDVTFSPPEPQPCDCDELRRLAREYVQAWDIMHDKGSARLLAKLRNFVREHTP